MKYTYICLFIISLLCSACQTEPTIVSEIKGGAVISEDGNSIAIPGYNDSESITLFIVRHAEKVDNSDDPPLSTVGAQRAKKLARILADVPMDMAASTNYLRTTQTANPFVTEAFQKGSKCEIAVYNPTDLPFFFGDIHEKRMGQKILVIGHSNSVPPLLNLLTGKKVYTDIPETDYDNFYIVDYKGPGDAEVLELKY